MPGPGELAAEYDGSEFQLTGIVSDVQDGACLGGVVGSTAKSEREELIHELPEET